MKRLFYILSCLFLLLSYCSPALSADQIKVFADGNQLQFDVAPVIENGRTLVPVRAIFESLGATVSWDSKTNTVIAFKDKLKISLPIGKTTATVGNAINTLEVPAKIINNRTLVPLRFISEALGSTVSWNGTLKLITITSAPSGEGVKINGYIETTVTNVVDGDSIEVMVNNTTEKIRLIGIDTPETVHTTVGEEPFEKEASEYTKKQLINQKVRLVFDVGLRDQYGRLLAYVFKGSQFINESLVSEGYAKVSTYAPNVKYSKMFTWLQQAARESKKGLWAGESTIQPPIKSQETPSVLTSNVVIVSIDKAKENVVIKNQGTSSIDLNGWKLVSEKGSQQYIFKAYGLSPGQTISVISGNDVLAGAGEILWTTDNIWNNYEDDPGALYDGTGNLVSRKI